MREKKILISCMLIFVVFIFSSCSAPEKTYSPSIYKVVSIFQYTEYDTNRFGGVTDTSVKYKFDYLDENNVLYTVSGFENLQYGLTKVQISDDYDKYVVDGENRYLCLTVDTLNQLTGIG